MSDLSHLREIDSALAGRSVDRDALVAQSWRRCVEQYGMDPAKPSPAHIVTEARLREHREQSERLIAIARSGLEALFRQIAGQKYVLLLADAKGVTVDYFGDPKFEDELRQAGLYLGSDWSENLAGTCGVGSCIVTKEAVTIHQSDHFDLTHTPLSCTAAPIFDTGGNLAAVLDISLLRSPQPKISQSLALNLVKASVRRVEMANLMAINRGDWVLRFSTSPEFLDVDPEAAVALDGSGRIIGMTHGAETVLKRQVAGQEPLIGARIDRFFDLSVDSLPDLMRGRPTEDRLISLQDGQGMFGHAIAPQSERRPAPVPNGMPAAFQSIGGADPAIQRLLGEAARLAPTAIPLLVAGEIGTGKERLVRAIHTSQGGSRPFVTLTCAAPREDWEAMADAAEGGTLFIDAPEDLDVAGQGRLLRIIAGGDALALRRKPRLVAASAVDLAGMVRGGAFRADLFFRLAAVTLALPPLRMRQDFDWLVDRMMRQFGHLRPVSLRLSPAARAELKARAWPGNLRELANTLEVAIALAEGAVIDLPDLPTAPLAVVEDGESLADVLAACGGNMSLAARRLGVNRSTILRRARREGLLPH
ncbi:sigma-54-dependent Fis family transcriptional regulator [Paragemmobacter straminiformis]|uniref:Sigma-54-dependent Fis family transcriptional regulator n=1 Tax=Paragemmobacter straminiformis TaxID=2045119 RepID=A0A842IC75_9RHOB|nr:sigma-54-dependent Fis family transcriptional regulator [Gemmobacter straminiformis]MBC2837440.1 sigma-54-dependent Fis family transcriptional regulator [Gemmobacter straminiformis]